MARFEVTVSEMQNAANKISQAAENFRSAAQQVLNSAQQLSGTWEGDSQVAFLAEQEQANQWYNKVMEIVTTYVESLNNAAKAYQAADEAAAANIKSH